ncbi:GNAT family N-acetyltransferase [Sphingomonas solaris]|uniref:GNAT family N-acetyltransferase n=1 Tax=Alterirhizorhabdus solaris TaxID=2529389 RepID=A0A558QVG8_9SPHN|nr:N-acetyltransferase [Sphingomonas solaris]TVV71062.1 GNAT family N-acetyltransferase [Sphingomonas solaris]
MIAPTIRPAIPADAAALARLKLETFRATFLADGFAIPYPPADLARFEQASYSVETVAREIADPAHATWIGEVAGAMAGYAHVGPCKLPHPDVAGGAGELYQLYVAKAAQGSGLGRRLLDTALDHLAATRPGPVWLGVWSGNERAQAIYAARGFANVGGYRFPVGDWHDDEFIFRRD